MQTAGRRITIGGTTENFSESYIRTAASSDAVILLTAKPEFTGGLERVIEIKPDIEIYATSAGLRNIKQIVNREINEQLIKDGMELGEIRFFITPNISWVDSCMALYEGVLFSGEAFSGFEGSAVDLKNAFEQRLAVNKAFVLSATERLEKESITAIYPAYGSAMPQGTVCMSALPEEVFKIYRKWCHTENTDRIKAAVVYSSRYGYTKSLADRLIERLGAAFDVSASDVDKTENSAVIDILNTADVIIVGTDTINRSAPKRIWDAVTGIDMVNKKGTPYFVFGSYGWSGDGTKLIEKTLGAMGLRQIIKPVEVILKPDAADFERLDKAAERIIAYVGENCGK
ncbi:MAG: flavodoxin domain-containing protein [Candidatus Ornithomonoglobus sp.]